MPEGLLAIALNWKKTLADANAMIELKEYKRALMLLDDALKMAETLSPEEGPEDLRIADTLERIAFSYHCLGRLQEAEPLYRRAIEIAVPRIFGIDTEELATENLANLLSETDRAAEGEKMREEIAEKYPKQQTDKLQLNISLPLATPENGIMSSLGSLARGNPNLIIPIMKELLELIETVYGADSLEAVNALEQLGDSSQMGAEYHQRALQIKQRRLDVDEAAIAFSMRKLAETHTDSTLRRALLAKAHSIEKKLGITYVIDQTLGALHSLLGTKPAPDMSLEQAEAILAAREQQTQDEPPFVEMTLTKEQRYRQLVLMLEKVLTAADEIERGKDYPLTTLCLLSAARRVHEEFGEIELAKAQLEKEMKLIAGSWGDGHAMMVDAYEAYEKLCDG